MAQRLCQSLPLAAVVVFISSSFNGSWPSAALGKSGVKRKAHLEKRLEMVLVFSLFQALTNQKITKAMVMSLKGSQPRSSSNFLIA